MKHIDLFDFVLGYLEDRKLLEKTLLMQREKGDQALLKALAGPLPGNKLALVFAEKVRPDQNDLALVTGVGSVWSLLRSLSLLNNLHPVMGRTPLVLFYPGHTTANRSGCLRDSRTSTITGLSG